MTGPSTYSRDAHAAQRARADLDRAAELVSSMESTRRALIGSLAEMWPDAAWIAAGVRSARQWLTTYTGLSAREAKRLEQIAELCSRHSGLCAAVVAGELSLGRAETLARAVTPERAPWIAGIADTFIRFDGSDDDFDAAVRYWRERVDEQLAPRRVQRQTVVFSNRLFGGGDIHCSLLPVTFENVCAAIDAFTQDPDPADAPYQRTQSERRADGLDDLSVFGLTHDTDSSEDDLEDEQLRAEDTFDGGYPGDTLDEALDPANEDLDELELLRAKARKADQHQRRRTSRLVRPRSGVTVNAHIDLRTLAGTRDIDDLDGLVLRGEGWNLARSAAEQLLCDSSLVVTLFDGKTKILDANDAAEQFNKRQRRAIAARDHHCVFPGCTRVPKHCDVHHLEERHNGGPTVVSNGCLLCRFHHRLLHQHHWTLRQDDDGRWVATDPHGTEWKGRPTNVAAA
ncbi:HNH endonuclease signature motif containing protein [Actinospongicola halichondriae]|uniref:HNH endonuclease signature motif containing protein n=1 Tax=Actinospongicola halichondriae TaxID=3236844 RepID=UPI003D577253